METSTISSALRKKINVVQTRVDLTVQPQDDENIAKVLGVDAKANIANCQILNGEANYTANVVFDVAYQTDSKEISNMQDKTSVTGKIDDNTLSNLMEPIYKIEIVDVSIENASSSEVRVSATLEITLEVIDTNEINKFVPVDNNVFVKSQVCPVLTKCDSGQNTVTVDSDFEIKQNVAKLLCSSTDVCVKSLTAGTGYYTIEGEIYAKAYMCIKDGEDVSYKLFSETIPFKEEVDAENLQKDCKMEASVCIKCDEVMFGLETQENGSLIKISVPLLVRYVALKEQEMELPCDAYSLTHKLNLVTDTYFASTIEHNTHKHHVEGSIEISENMPRIAKVLMVMNGNLNITNAVNQNGSVLVEGVLTTTVVYKADDDEESINSVQVELPFSLTFDEENIKADDELYVFGNIVDIVIKAKKGKELEIDADLVFDVDNYNKKAEPFVKEVILTEELAKNPYPLSIYLAPAGSTLWDISKHLNVQEDLIVAQNPNLEYPLASPESIIYFNQR